MPEQPSIESLKEIASQLRHPFGETGLVTSKNMADNNGNMILQTIAQMELREFESILEIGPGGGRHVNLLFTTIGNLDYYGIDVSELMVEEATKINAAFAQSGNVTFTLTDGLTIPFADEFFSKAFTVNTLYFWANPQAYAKEICRVLKPGANFYLSFAAKDFMQKLPFTPYGFTLYSEQEAKELLQSAGFRISEVNVHTEEVRISATEKIEREFIVITASK